MICKVWIQRTALNHSQLSAYTLDPTWKNLVWLAGGAVVDSFRRIDF
jgi:hypothetical protein